MESWPTDLSPEELAHLLGQRFDGTLMEHLGMRVIEMGKERTVVEMAIHPGLTTPSGHVHAGSMVSLADTAATFAAMAASEPVTPLNEMPVAVSISTQIVGNVK